MSENINTENNQAEGAGAAEIAPAQVNVNNAEEAIQTPQAEVAATTATIKIEGQEFPLDVAIAADDNLLKTALSPHYPSIKNAQISRETRLGEMIVSIVKKAEHKGFWAKPL
jgi:hypothetical protein